MPYNNHAKNNAPSMCDLHNRPFQMQSKFSGKDLLHRVRQDIRHRSPQVLRVYKRMAQGKRRSGIQERAGTACRKYPPTATPRLTTTFHFVLSCHVMLRHDCCKIGAWHKLTLCLYHVCLSWLMAKVLCKKKHNKRGHDDNDLCYCGMCGELFCDECYDDCPNCG